MIRQVTCSSSIGERTSPSPRRSRARVIAGRPPGVPHEAVQQATVDDAPEPAPLFIGFSVVLVSLAVRGLLALVVDVARLVSAG
jgi:hypothetical protein